MAYLSDNAREAGEKRWRIGDAPNDIKLGDLVLVSTHQSLESWQPHLRLVHAREPRMAAPLTLIPYLPLQFPSLNPLEFRIEAPLNPFG